MEPPMATCTYTNNTMIGINHMLPHVMWLIVTWANLVTISIGVDNRYNMTKLSQWNYACNISMTKMSQGKYTCSSHDKYTYRLKIGNMTKSSQWSYILKSY
jgi:hypothetical protein